jgi:hypothetical protein
MQTGAGAAASVLRIGTNGSMTDAFVREITGSDLPRVNEAVRVAFEADAARAGGMDAEQGSAVEAHAPDADLLLRLVKELLLCVTVNSRARLPFHSSPERCMIEMQLNCRVAVAFVDTVPDTIDGFL